MLDGLTWKSGDQTREGRTKTEGLRPSGCGWSIGLGSAGRFISSADYRAGGFGSVGTENHRAIKLVFVACPNTPNLKWIRSGVNLRVG